MTTFNYLLKRFLKKLLVIALLGIYLFNLVGYSLYYRYCISRSDEKIVKQIEDKRYNDNDLTEIKVPVNLPYYNNSNQYENVEGEIEINGSHYNYVKRKISNDTVYLMCMPNNAKTQLYKDKNNYASQANDLPAGGKENNTAKKNSFSNEYVSYSVHYSISTPVTTLQSFYKSGSIHNLSQGHHNLPGQPPEIAA